MDPDPGLAFNARPQRRPNPVMPFAPPSFETGLPPLPGLNIPPSFGRSFSAPGVTTTDTRQRRRLAVDDIDADAFPVPPLLSGPPRRQYGAVPVAPAAEAPVRTAGKRALYGSHLLQTFGDRMWQFAVPVLLATLLPGTLLFPALYQCSVDLGVFFGVPLLGDLLAHYPRVRGACMTATAQNLCALLSCTVLFVAPMVLASAGPDAGSSWQAYAVLGFLVLFGVLGDCAGHATTVAVTKDWVPIMFPVRQTRDFTNARLKRIDLISKILAPGCFALGVQYLGGDDNARKTVQAGALVVAAFNAAALLPQVQWLRQAARHHRQLARAAAASSTPVNLLDSWRAFAACPQLGAAVAYCFCFFSILDSGPLLTTYLNQEGASMTLLFMARAAGALCGLCGTWLAPHLRTVRGWSARRVGATMLCAYALAVSPCGVVLLVPWRVPAVAGVQGAAAVMLAATACMRVPLWAYATTHTLIMQEVEPRERRAPINAAQRALRQLFKVAIVVLGVVFHRLDQFGILAAVSAASIATAAAVFTCWAVRTSAPPPSD